MLQNLPPGVTMGFMLITLVTVFLFFMATRYSKTFLLVTLAWLGLQAYAGISRFYLVSKTVPPRFALLAVPPLLVIGILFATAKGRKFIDSFDMEMLTLLHTIRIPVEIMLFYLSVHKLVPQLMTFEGRNFDIIAGITAPFVAYFGFMRAKLGRKALLAWNFICLGLLLNIVVIAVLSVPSAFQAFAFDRPNKAVLYFPFVWLPCCVVPLVLFAHLAAIRKLISKNAGESLRVSYVNRDKKQVVR